MRIYNSVENFSTLQNKKKFKKNVPSVSIFTSPKNTNNNDKNVIGFCRKNIKFGSAKILLKNFNSNKNTTLLNFLSDIKETGSSVKDFLTKILENDETRSKFIDEITKEPKKSQKVVRFLERKLDGKKNFVDWYLGKNGYVEAYEQYLHDKFGKAKSIAELVKIQPNWGYWAFEMKHVQLLREANKQDELMKYPEVNFNFGFLPESFINKFYFDRLVERIKGFKFGIKNKKVRLLNNNFLISQLDGGNESSKNIYEVISGKNKYIIKMDRFYVEDKLKNEKNTYYPKFAKESKLLRGDSIYLNACLDYYLQLNGATSNAKLLYYDFAKNVSIHEFIDAHEVNETSINDYIEQVTANKKFKDINDLGVFVNDIKTGNYYKDSKGEFKIIDIGHAEFIDILKPGAKQLTIEMSNVCGYSLKNILAGLNLSSFSKLINKKTSDISQTRTSVKTRKKSEFSTDTPINYGLFIKNKDRIKRNIKENIKLSTQQYGKSSSQALNARKQLIEFYKNSILAQKAHSSIDDKKIINKLLQSLKREIKYIEENDKEGIYSECCEQYKIFIAEQKNY